MPVSNIGGDNLPKYCRVLKAGSGLYA